MTISQQVQKMKEDIEQGVESTAGCQRQIEEQTAFAVR